LFLTKGDFLFIIYHCILISALYFFSIVYLWNLHKTDSNQREVISQLFLLDELVFFIWFIFLSLQHMVSILSIKLQSPWSAHKWLLQVQNNQLKMNGSFYKWLQEPYNQESHLFIQSYLILLFLQLQNLLFLHIHFIKILHFMALNHDE
jgi:hypothetical protein